jgi:hypothetical protein
MAKSDSSNWFAADKDGLAQILEHRGKAWVIGELVQNSWDEDGVTEVNIWLTPIEGKPYAQLCVEDNSPEGWSDMTDSFTFYRASKKKGDPLKRGRFNIGHKLAMSICTVAEIISMNTAMLFDAKGRRPSKKRVSIGTRFTATIRMTRAEYAEVEAYILTLLQPDGMATTFNGDNLIPREPEVTFVDTLPTVTADEHGNIKPTRRKSEVQIFEPLADEVPMLYEMGIPVVETGDKWHVNVMQKVPLNTDRNNVTPSYLQKIRTAVLNRMVRELDDEETANTWVQAATEDPDIQDEVVDQYMDKRFGKKRVAYDPSDREANNIAVTKGYTVVHGNSMSSAQWKNAKRAEAILPAGQVTPSPKATFSSTGKDVTIPREKWTEGMVEVAELAHALGKRLMGISIHVTMLNDPRGFNACYGDGGDLSFNVRRLGKSWFNQMGEKTLDLIIHEFGHEYASNHLSDEFYRALTRLGAKLAGVVYTEPELFKGVFRS